MQTLFCLGASRIVLWQIGVLEALLAGMPVALVVTLFWLFLSPRMRTIPFTPRDVFAGDLTVRPWQCMVCLAVMALMMARSSAVITCGNSAGGRQVRRGKRVLRAALVVGVG